MKLACIVVTLASILIASADSPPQGWWSGKVPGYETGVDKTVTREGKPSAFIRSIAENPSDFTALNQVFQARDYRGKRVRLQGYLKTSEVKSWAGFWVRGDAANGQAVAFANMQNRGMKGTSDWTPAEIVLDIPEDAETISMGLILQGAGQVWMNDLSFQIVDKATPVSNPTAPTLPLQPVNLDFTE
jgi:hypothetical protein